MPDNEPATREEVLALVEAASAQARYAEQEVATIRAIRATQESQAECLSDLEDKLNGWVRWLIASLFALVLGQCGVVLKLVIELVRAYAQNGE